MTNHLPPRQPVRKPEPQVKKEPEPHLPEMAQCPKCNYLMEVTGIPIAGPSGRFVYHVKCPRCHNAFGHVRGHD